MRRRVAGLVRRITHGPRSANINESTDNMAKKTKGGVLILGNHLFPLSELSAYAAMPVFMSEDWELCTYTRHHQQKLVLFLAAMREYADELTKHGFAVNYHRLEDTDKAPYEKRLASFVKYQKLTELVHFEIEDHFFAERIDAFCVDHGLKQTVVQSPMFLTSRKAFADYNAGAKRPFMAEFYKRQRREFGILIDDHGAPVGGKWSFDEANRRKLPKHINPPPVPVSKPTQHTRDVIALVRDHFAAHPGDAGDFWWPVTRRTALAWLRNFLQHRLSLFGDYQDALTQRSETVFHSVLSPLLNVGLLTPRDLVERAIATQREHDIPMNSLEGFIRQVIGWREFVRGIYHEYDATQREANFWNHHRKPTDAWYRGETGLPPLDHAIKTANALGWTHHITRLMVVGNLMTLSEIAPRAAHDWFMEMHIDSADWVMGPNVYGMALFSDGGIFATKPYICGSNYLLKMSDYGKGEWCDVVDGLYWRFIENHQPFFAGNPRLSMMARMLKKINAERKTRLYRAADAFLAEHTTN